MATVTVGGSVANLDGKELKVGDLAPKVVLVGKDLGDLTVGGAQDHIQILVSVPSLDTGVCAAETRKFNEKAGAANGVKLTVISMDLPFAMGRFCTTEGIENVAPASDFRAKEFGKNYGVLIKDGKLAGLLARTIFVVGKDGKVAYKQVVAEVTTEPNYEEIQKAVSALSGGSCGCSCGA